MVLNQAVLNFNDLDEIHLISRRGCTRVLPHKPDSVGQIAGTEMLPRFRFSLEDHLNEAPQLVLAAANATFCTEQMGNQRTLNRRIGSVKRQG